MKQSTPLITLFSIVVLLTASTLSYACACCSDQGQYDVFTGIPQKTQLELLKDLHPDSAVQLYMTDGEDEPKGLGNIGFDNLSLVDVYTNNIWKFEIRSASGKSGTLVLPRPARMTYKKIDIHDRDEGDPMLYKELMFEGTVARGGGEFKAGIVASARYTLLFQGRGNNCDNVGDFTHWRLEVKGPKASYAFFGRMKAIEPAAAQ